MNRPTPMKHNVLQYLQARRAMGFQMSVVGTELMRFAAYADSIAHRGPITTELTLRWAASAKGCSRLYQARRVEMVRCLARYLSAYQPGTEIAPRKILGPAHRRTAPYLYTPEEITSLMHAAAQLPPRRGLRAKTYSTLIGLLACTGLRVGEALALRREHFSPAERLLLVEQTKFHKSRIVPLHSSAVAALQRYAAFRDAYCPRPLSRSFFLSEHGGPISGNVADWTFRKLRATLHQRQRSRSRPPRLSDLRHTFACRRLLQWYREGREVNHAIAWLSVYLGHVKVSDTYWYLNAVPELMRIVAERFEHFSTASRGESS